MKRIVIVSALAVLVSGSAMAQNAGSPDRTTTGQAGGYAYCLKTSPGPGDCKYNTMAQCKAAMSGTNSECVKNNGPR